MNDAKGRELSRGQVVRWKRAGDAGDYYALVEDFTMKKVRIRILGHCWRRTGAGGVRDVFPYSLTIPVANTWPSWVSEAAQGV